MRTPAERLVTDELWAIVRPLLPRPPRHCQLGVPPSRRPDTTLEGLR
jgi:transposase